MTTLTVDVERDWGAGGLRGVREALPELLRRLAGRGLRATFFTVGELASELRECLPPDGPHEVGSHGLTHRLLDQLTPAEARQELVESKARLEAHGYRIDGFRAPYLRGRPDLMCMLREAGYAYDASRGSVFPSWRNRRPGPVPEDGLPRLGASTLRDGLTPFNLTWLRLLHPLGRRMVVPRATHFSCHLHEFVGTHEAGTPQPSPLRRLHARHAGALAWDLLDELLDDPARRFVTCRELLAPGGAGV